MERNCDVCNGKFQSSELYKARNSSNEEQVVCESCIASESLEDNFYYPLEEDYGYMDKADQEEWDNLIDNYEEN